MKNGIGPQSLGASGLSPNSKPCGSPLDASASQNAAFGPGSKLAKENPERAAAILDGINEADSAVNSGSPLNSQMPGLGVGGGGMIGGIGSLATTFGGATARKRRLLASRNPGAFGDGRAAIATNAASPGGAGMQADLEGLQTKLADLKSQIDNLANTV